MHTRVNNKTGVWLNKAAKLNQKGKCAEARSFCAKVLKAEPNSAIGHRLMGAILTNEKNYHSAEHHLKCSLQSEPTHIQTKYLLATVLSENQKTAEANVLFQEMLEEDENLQYWRDYALSLSRGGHVEAALKIYRQLTDLCPDDLKLRYNMAEDLLSIGEFEQGWDGYELRYQKTAEVKPAPTVATEVNSADALVDKNVLIYREQGIGDEILFASCYQDVIHCARQVIIVCEPRLKRIFERSFPTASIVAADQMVREIALLSTQVDCQIGAGSLPRCFRRDKQSFSRDKPYMICDPSRVDHWRNEFSALPHRTTVGISWKGGNNTHQLNYRSLHLAQLSDLLAQAPVNWVSLQHGDTKAERQQLQTNTGIVLHRYTEALPEGDMDEFLSLMSGLDYVVTVDNTVAHLAGAIYAPGCVMLPASGSWQWPLYTDGAWWYPSLRRIRRDKDSSDWQPVIMQALTALKALLV